MTTVNPSKSTDYTPQIKSVPGSGAASGSGKTDPALPPLGADTGVSDRLKQDIPLLADPKFGSLGLEQLLEALTQGERKTLVEQGLKALESKKAELKQLHAEKMEKIEENLANLKEKGILDDFLTAMKWVGMVLGSIASAAVLVVGIATANPLLIAGGLICLTMSINSMVSEATDGEYSIAAGVAALAEKCGADPETAKWIGMAAEMAITIAGIACTMGGAAATQGPQALNSMITAVNLVNGANTVIQAGVKIAAAVYDYKIEQVKAEIQELEAILQRIMATMESERDMVEAVMERNQELFGKVTDIVKGNIMAQTAVQSGHAPSMA